MLKIFVITALIAAFVLFAAMVGMIAFSSEQSKTDDHAKPAVAENSNSEDRKSMTDKEAANDSKEAKQKRDWYYTFIEHPTEWLLVLFNGLLVLATIALFVSGERNVEVARKSAKAAQAAADAARDSVKLAGEVAEQQLRAYVFADAQEIRKFGFNEVPEGWLFFKNSGATPAFDFERGAKLMYTKFPATEFPEIEWSGAKGYLAPHGEIFFGPIALPRALTAAETANVIAGTHAVYLFGKVKYIDAFKKPRFIEFRSFYRGNGSRPPSQTLATQQDPNGNSGN